MGRAVPGGDLKGALSSLGVGLCKVIHDIGLCQVLTGKYLRGLSSNISNK